MMADLAEGRIIHITLDIRLTPREDDEIGSTDSAWELGVSIVDDLARLLYIIGSNEGFKVDVERRNVVY